MLECRAAARAAPVMKKRKRKRQARTSSQSARKAAALAAKPSFDQISDYQAAVQNNRWKKMTPEQRSEYGRRIQRGMPFKRFFDNRLMELSITNRLIVAVKRPELEKQMKREFFSIT